MDMESQYDFLSFLNDAVWCFDVISQQFRYVNQRLADIYGTSLDVLKDNPFIWRRLVHPDDYSFVDKKMGRLYLGESVEIEYRILVGSLVRWVSDKRSPVADNKGKLEVITGILSDITEKKEAELKLAQSEYIYRSLFDNNPNPLWIYNTETLRFLAVNRAAIDKYGYSEEEFLSMTLADIRPAEDIEKLRATVGRLGRYSHSKGWRHYTKKGHLLYVNISGYATTYKGQKAEIVMVHDITPQVRNQKEIIIAKRKLDALINNINDLIWSVDRNYRLLSSNLSFQRSVEFLFGKKLLGGDSVFDPSVPKREVEHWKKNYDRVLKGERLLFNMTTSRGGKKTFEIRMLPIMNEHEIIGVVCVGRDIQRKLEAEKRLILQNIELKEVVALASHEIRGPVTSLMGLINIFNKANLSDPFNGEIIGYIEDTINELDGVIHKIVEKSHSIQIDNEAIYSSLQNQSDYE